MSQAAHINTSPQNSTLDSRPTVIKMCSTQDIAF